LAAAVVPGIVSVHRLCFLMPSLAAPACAL
jgi:hypothetical protein